MSELRDTRLEKANALKELDQGPYAISFDPTHRMQVLQDEHGDLEKGAERDVTVSVAGRVMTRRVMGKLAFFTSPMKPEPFSCSWRRRALRPGRRDGSSRSPHWSTRVTGWG